MNRCGPNLASRVSRSNESGKISVVPRAKAVTQAQEFYQNRYPTKPKVGVVELIRRYKNGQTQPISALHQLSQTTGFELDIKETVTTGNITTLSYFAYCAVIDGQEYTTGMGSSKKEAKTRAAELALRDLIPVLENEELARSAGGGAGAPTVPPPLPVKEPGVTAPVESPLGLLVHERKKNPLEEHVRSTVEESIKKLLEKHPEFSDCGRTVAAFVTQSTTGFEVVAVGTGSCNAKESKPSNGRTLHDSHAVVIARRSLLRYLYRHLLLFFSKNSQLQEKSIFQQDQTTKLLSLKSDVTLHLYTNHLPKGAAQIAPHMRLNPLSMSAWEVNNQISLHQIVEGKVFSVFSSSVDQMASGMVSMSATDKITRWQVLGLQGALLSHFMEPVYVSSILIGNESCSSPRGMDIAVNQRVDGITTRLPIYYCVHRPHIGLVAGITAPGWSNTQRTLSINWSQGDVSLEVVNGPEGKTVDESPFKSGPTLASRLCKAAMYSRFNVVAKEAQREELMCGVSYREAKMMARPYQEAKAMFKTCLAQNGFGSWGEKPAVNEDFAL